MAFTFSHAVVAPYLHRIFKHRIPLAALTVGTMLPDITRVVFPSPMAHHFSGMFSINLICGTILCILWYWLYRPVLYTFMQWEMPSHLLRNQYFSFSLLCILALLIGNLSHLIWDSFTHADDRTWFFRDFLSQNLVLSEWVISRHRLLQYATSILVLPWLYLGFKPYTQTKHLVAISHNINRQQFKRHLIKASIVGAVVCVSASLYFYLYAPVSIYALMVYLTKYLSLVILGYFSILSVICIPELKAKSLI